MLPIILRRSFSKYRQVTDIVKRHPKPAQVQSTEPTINFKPFTQTVYKASGNIKPYRDFEYPITKEHEVAEVALYDYATRLDDINSPPNAKVMTLGVFGPTNSGKSSVFNKLVGRDVSAVSNKVFTTSKAIFGVKTDIDTNTQLCIYDLPGYPLGSAKMRFYQQEAYKKIDEVLPSKLLMVFDANKTIQKDELVTLNKIRERFADQLDFILVLNKLDLCFNRRKLYDLVAACESMMNFESKFYVSTETDYGIQGVIDHLVAQASPGKWQVPQGYSTDLSEVGICHQQVKSVIFNRYFEEFPYEMGIKIDEFFLSSSHIRVGVKLNVERELHKRVIVGEEGKNLVVLKNHIAKQLMIFYNKFVEVVLTVHHGLKEYREPHITEQAVQTRTRAEIEQLKGKGDVKQIK